MKKKEKQEQAQEAQDNEILKAVAQAWHGRSANRPPRPMKEFDAQRQQNHHHKTTTRPTRFKLEAVNMGSKEKETVCSSPTWDFSQSLWDSYELVTLSRKLEYKLVMDHDPLEGGPPPDPARKWGSKESKNSLRSLFTRSSSARYDGDIRSNSKHNGPHNRDAS